MPPAEVLSEREFLNGADSAGDLRCNMKKTGARYSDLIAPRGAIFHVVAPGATYSLP
jgi:hypothetical protein